MQLCCRGFSLQKGSGSARMGEGVPTRVHSTLAVLSGGRKERETVKPQVHSVKKRKRLISPGAPEGVWEESGSVWTESPNVISCVWALF